jgi:hypothetical protein
MKTCKNLIKAVLSVMISLFVLSGCKEPSQTIELTRKTTASTITASTTTGLPTTTLTTTALTTTAATITSAADAIIIENDVGLFIESFTGDVAVTGESGDKQITAKLRLLDGEIITVGGDSSATLVYKGNEISETNYIVLSENSQAVVSGKWNGSGEEEIFLNHGTAICNLAGESKGKINIRTSNALIYVDKTVTIVSNYQSENNTYTDVFDFMGNSKLALYDETEQQVNEVELLLETRRASIVTSDRGPYFEYLNVEFSLSVLTANDLRHLIMIAQTVDSFPYSLNDLKTALENAQSAKNLS